MYRWKKILALTWFITLLVVLLLIFGILLYVSTPKTGPIKDIFHITLANSENCFIVSIIMIALAAGLFVLGITLLIFFLVSYYYNKRTIKTIKDLIKNFANAEFVTEEEVISALQDLDRDIQFAKKNGMNLTPQTYYDSKPNQTINIVNNYQNYNQQDNQPVTTKKVVETTTTYKTNTIGAVPPPPPPPVLNNNVPLVSPTK